MTPDSVRRLDLEYLRCVTMKRRVAQAQARRTDERLEGWALVSEARLDRRQPQ